MNAVGKSVDIEIYDGAGHAFENPANKCGYRPKATANAWFRTLRFFDQAKELKSPVS
jgi:carboxymethylenebutenolidase